jgi:hypothetical protein
MAVVEQDYEAGTLGATIASGTNGLVVTGTPIYDGTNPAHGTKSAKITSTGTTEILGHTPGGSNAAAAARASVWASAPPTSNMDLLTLRSASANAAKLTYLSSGKVQLQNAAGTALDTSTAALPTSGQLRFELRAVEATSTTGEIHAAVYSGDGTTPIWSSDQLNVNAGTAVITSARVGKQTATGNWTAWIDDFAIDIGRTTFIGPHAGGGGGGGGPTIVMSDDFVGAIATAFVGDSIYLNLAGQSPAFAFNGAGGKALRFSAAQQGIVQQLFTSTQKRVFDRIWRLSAAATKDCEVVQVRIGGGRGPACVLTSGNKLRLLKTDGSASNTSTVSMPVGVDFRVCWTVDGTTLKAEIYADTTSTTPLETVTGVIPAAIDMTAGRDGIISAGGLGDGVTFDVSWPVDTSDINPGPRTYPSYPVEPAQASAGPDRSGIEPGTTVTVDVTDVQGTHAITARALTCLTGTGLTSVTLTNTGTRQWTYKAPASLAGTTVRLRYSVTTSDGVVTDDADHVVLLIAERMQQSGLAIPVMARG